MVFEREAELFMLGADAPLILGLFTRGDMADELGFGLDPGAFAACVIGAAHGWWSPRQGKSVWPHS